MTEPAGSDDLDSDDAVLLDVRFPASLCVLSSMRSLIASAFSALGLSLGDWPLIATELVTNAVTHTSTADVSMTFRQQDWSSIQMAVRNEAALNDPGPSFADLKPPNSEPGAARGLALVLAMTDSQRVERTRGHTIVVVTCQAPLTGINEDRMKGVR